MNKSKGRVSTRTMDGWNPDIYYKTSQELTLQTLSNDLDSPKPWVHDPRKPSEMIQKHDFPIDMNIWAAYVAAGPTRFSTSVTTIPSFSLIFWHSNWLFRGHDSLISNLDLFFVWILIQWCFNPRFVENHVKPTMWAFWPFCHFTREFGKTNQEQLRICHFSQNPKTPWNTKKAGVYMVVRCPKSWEMTTFCHFWGFFPQSSR